jgi:hypothetical protein
MNFMPIMYIFGMCLAPIFRAKTDLKGIIMMQPDPVCGLQVDEQSAAAGVLFPLFRILLNPIFAAAGTGLSAVTVVIKALRLRRFKPPVIDQKTAVALNRGRQNVWVMTRQELMRETGRDWMTALQLNKVIK